MIPVTGTGSALSVVGGIARWLRQSVCGTIALLKVVGDALNRANPTKDVAPSRNEEREEEWISNCQQAIDKWN